MNQSEIDRYLAEYGLVLNPEKNRYEKKEDGRVIEYCSVAMSRHVAMAIKVKKLREMM